MEIKKTRNASIDSLFDDGSNLKLIANHCIYSTNFNFVNIGSFCHNVESWNMLLIEKVIGFYVYDYVYELTISKQFEECQVSFRKVSVL